MPGWKLTDLGTVPRYRHLPVIANRPVAINSQGEVVGSSTTPLIPGPVNGVVNVPERVFLWQRGKITDLGKASSDGINDRGEIVGSGLWPSGHALLWRHGKRIDLGTLGGRSSEAARIDDHGQVIGTSDLRESTPRSLHQHAFIWQNGKMTDLGTLGGANSRAIAINDHGQVIGVSDTAATGHHHGFLWQNGRMTDLGTLGGWTSDPVAINDHGQIVGQSTTRGGTVHALLGEAFLWQDGKMTDLGPLPSHPVCHHKLAVLCESIHTVATAINDRGQVVGYSAGAGDNEHAFLWEKGKMTDLGTLGGILEHGGRHQRPRRDRGFQRLRGGPVLGSVRLEERKDGRSRNGSRDLDRPDGKGDHRVPRSRDALSQRELFHPRRVQGAPLDRALI